MVLIQVDDVHIVMLMQQYAVHMHADSLLQVVSDYLIPLLHYSSCFTVYVCYM
jgi:hypothetical protein